MPSTITRRFLQKAVPALACIGFMLSLATRASATGLTQADINPLYLSNNFDESAAQTLGNNPSSYGYFFQVDGNNYRRRLNALGFAILNGWDSAFDVNFYRINNDLTWTEISSATFDPATPGNYYTDVTNGYYWFDVSDVDLQAGGSYAITAAGNFAEDITGLPVLYGGTGTFASGYNYFDNGFVAQDSPSAAVYPFPLDQAVDGGNVPLYGFFNANASIVDAPGPLPLFGAAAAFGWSRRIRRRIKPSRTRSQR